MPEHYSQLILHTHTRTLWGRLQMETFIIFGSVVVNHNRTHTLSQAFAAVRNAKVEKACAADALICADRVCVGR